MERGKDRTMHEFKLATTSTEDDEHSGFFYIPDFITEQEERLLLREIYNAPALKWKTLVNRRLQTWGGQLAGKSGDTLIPQPLPSFFVKSVNLIERIASTGAFQQSKHDQPNHCLVNEYLSGQGIMPHEDGGAYFPAVATISLASHTLLDIFRYADVPPTEDPGSQTTNQTDQQSGPAGKARAREKDPAFSIFQERRSLLITTGSAYKKYLHGIAERQFDGPADLRNIVNLEQLGSSEFRAAISRLRQGGDFTPAASKDTTDTDDVELISPSASTHPDDANTTATSHSARASIAADATLDDGEDGSALGPLLPSLTASSSPVVTDAGLQRQTRVSLTFRDVEKVSKGLATLLGRGGGKR